MSAAITTPPVTTTQVYQLFIRATPEQIWEAITNPDFTEKYFHGARNEYSDGRRVSKGARRQRCTATRRSSPSTRHGGWCTAGARSTAPSWRPRRPAG